MAGFRAHLTAGAITGSGIGITGFLGGYLKATEAFAIAVTGTIGGLLPDLDSDTGKPLALLFQLISILIPVFIYPYFYQYFGGSVSFSICYFTISYLIINYGICSIIKKLTVHRGVMHSIPFAILCGEIAYLLLYPSGERFAFFGGICVFAGCMIHLILDEFNSITFKGGFIPVINKAGGTALKFTSSNIATIFSVYFFVLILGVGISMQFIEIPYLSDQMRRMF